VLGIDLELHPFFGDPLQTDFGFRNLFLVQGSKFKVQGSRVRGAVRDNFKP